MEHTNIPAHHVIGARALAVVSVRNTESETENIPCTVIDVWTNGIIVRLDDGRELGPCASEYVIACN